MGQGNDMEHFKKHCTRCGMEVTEGNIACPSCGCGHFASSRTQGSGGECVNETIEEMFDINRTKLKVKDSALDVKGASSIFREAKQHVLETQNAIDRAIKQYWNNRSLVQKFSDYRTGRKMPTWADVQTKDEWNDIRQYIQNLDGKYGKKLVINLMEDKEKYDRLREGRIQLRSEPINGLTAAMASKMISNKLFFDLHHNSSASEFPNDFVLQGYGKVVYDRTTGLMWQQSGSDNIGCESAKKYICNLNHEKFAGYNDWRLPTLEETMSLMKPTKNKDGLYTAPEFDNKQSKIWTSDMYKASYVWVVFFDLGVCYSSGSFDVDFFVRAVRSNCKKDNLSNITLGIFVFNSEDKGISGNYARHAKMALRERLAESAPMVLDDGWHVLSGDLLTDSTVRNMKKILKTAKNKSNTILLDSNLYTKFTSGELPSYIPYLIVVFYCPKEALKHADKRLKQDKTAGYAGAILLDISKEFEINTLKEINNGLYLSMTKLGSVD